MTREKRELGASGLAITPLVLGGNVFGWTADRTASFAVLDAFVDAGGDMIDTADVYSSWVPGNSGGESEAMIGEWLAHSGKRDRVLIATKVGMGEGGLRPERIVAGIDASLQRLGTDRVDLYFAHRDDPDVPLADVQETLGRLVEAGKVRAIGASNFSALRFKEAIDHSADRRAGRFTVLQPLYNLLKRDRFEGELQDLAVTHNIGVVAYSALASGFLTGKYRTADDLARGARGAGMEKLLAGGTPLLAAMDEIVAERGGTHAQLSLAWLLAQPGVTAPIASATTVDQLHDLMAALDMPLSEDHLARLDALG